MLMPLAQGLQLENEPQSSALRELTEGWGGSGGNSQGHCIVTIALVGFSRCCGADGGMSSLGGSDIKGEAAEESKGRVSHQEGTAWVKNGRLKQRGGYDNSLDILQYTCFSQGRYCI